MPLQIRRGTETERQTLTTPLAEGEPLFVTDTGKLYLGDGVTAGADLESIKVDAEPLTIEGTVTGDLIPDEDSAYDIGNLENKIRSLYLSESGLNIGEAQITAEGSTIDLPAGSTVGGVLIGSNIVSGETIDGNTYKINISSFDSSLIIDSNNNTITTNDLNLNNRLVFNNIDTYITTNNDGFLIIDGESELGTSLMIKSFGRQGLLMIDRVSDAASDGATMGFRSFRGDFNSPSLVVNGDSLGLILFQGYTGVSDLVNGNNGYAEAAFIGAYIEDSSNLSEQAYIQSAIFLGTGQDFDSYLKIRPGGIVDSKILKVGSYTQTPPEDTRPTALAEPGMIIFVSDAPTNFKFQGWDGSSWVPLG
jgi:hypothetical protein